MRQLALRDIILAIANSAKSNCIHFANHISQITSPAASQHLANLQGYMLIESAKEISYFIATAALIIVNMNNKVTGYEIII